METQDLVSLLMNQAASDNPIRYANLLRATRSDEIQQIKDMLPGMKKQLELYEGIAKQAREFRKQVSGDGYARRRKDSKKIFEGLDKQSDTMRDVGAVDVSHLLSAHFENITNIYSTLVQGADLIANAEMISLDKSVNEWSKTMDGNSELLGKDRIEALLSKVNDGASDAIQSLHLEQQVNRGASSSFTQGLMMLEQVPKQYEQYLQYQARNFEAYYQRLSHRHSDGGMVIAEHHGEPSVTLTDVAFLVWENIDKVGEIESGHSTNEISAYTVHRANAMVEAAKNPDVWQWLTNPGSQILSWASEARSTIKSVLEFVRSVKGILGDPVWKLLSLDPDKNYKEFNDIIESLDLNQITQRAPERAFSKTEKFAMEHRNKSIQSVADLLVHGSGLTGIVDEVIRLKIEEHEFFVMKNSFYVCRIGTGNMFTGEAPGAIEVIPGEKPNASLNNIWGGGFDEIRDFIDGMDDAKQWAPLFLATSPSGSTDKNNVLLVGPQGCGKTQVMRALGADNDSISIFAVGSDFLTCWMGEAQKNPKRLFDEAVKLHKSSGRPVHILIDEIDMVLNKDQSSSKTDLSLEFQNLMDGVVAYPGISIWGATNHPKRIPTPMLRRFAKVLVVGELTPEDSRTILKHYTETFLPCGDGFSEQAYTAWTDKLVGATGDVLRKAVDQVWLSLMRKFIVDHREDAEKIVAFIQEEYGDNFDVSDLTDDDREKIKCMVADTGTLVTESLVTKEITKLLGNAAIQTQIKGAAETYSNAKVLLEKAQAGNVEFGF